MSASTVTAAALSALLHNVPYRVCFGARELNPLTEPPVLDASAQVRHFVSCSDTGETAADTLVSGEMLRISLRTGHLLAAAELLTLLESGKIAADTLTFTPWDPAISVPRLTISHARLQKEWHFHPGKDGAPDSCELLWICRRSSGDTPLIHWEI